MDNNELSIKEFIISHVIIGACFLFLYRAIAFRNIEGCSFSTSKKILLACVVGSSLIGMLFEMKKNRENPKIFTNFILGFGIYTVVAYYDIKKSFIIISACVILFLSLVFAVLRMCRPIKTNDEKGRRLIIKKRIRYSLDSAGVLLLTGLVVIMIVIVVELRIRGSLLVVSNVDTTGMNISEEQYIEENISTLQKLESQRWKTLTLSEKEDVLRVCAELEMIHLGINEKIEIAFTNITKKTLKGYYSDQEKLVTISIDSLKNDSSDQLFNTMAHEIYHCYEYELCKVYNSVDGKLKTLYIFADVPTYIKEFSDYISSDEDIVEYSNQLCEEDSRKYAKSRTITIFTRIDASLGKYDADYHPQRVIYDDEGAWLVDNEGFRIAGPYEYIEDADWLTTLRYIDSNGLFGYIRNDGTLITPGLFTEASDMNQGIALVRKNESGVYYINAQGERITQYFEYGVELSGTSSFARAKTFDGKIALIDVNGDIVFEADYIPDLATGSHVGSAVDNGKALLFDLKRNDNGKYTIKCVLEYVDISMVYRGKYAIVSDPDGKKGVIDAEGKVLIPAAYDNIESETVYGENTGKEIIIFKLYSEASGYETFRYEP